MSGERNFHFTIGPVQAFVAQARRTRDFWAGSFLLSTLAAVALREVQAQGGRVLFPAPDEAFLRALSGEPVERPPQQGVVPNRFKAAVGAGFDPEAVCRAVRLAWVRIAELAWKRLPEDLRQGHDGLRRVWSRQIGVDLATGEPTRSDPFWQMTWALGDAAEGEDLLDRRKHLRIAAPPEEAGAKCMLMEGWQELSGIERPNRQALEEFWSGVHRHVTRHNRSDLVAGEQLCAPALVKRLFPHDFQRLREIPMPGGWKLSGWKLETGVPSVAYLAAAPWLARAVTVADEAEARGYVEAAGELDAGSERRTRLRLVEDALPPANDAVWAFAHLDGSLFFESSLRAEHRRELAARGKSEAEAQALVDRVLARLARIRRLPAPAPAPDDPEATLGEPLPHFAVLAMDGDRLGRNLADPERQPPITRALARFAAEVPAIVERHSGFLVYAGGDDVRALLPVPGALPCARELRRHYLACFAAEAIESTLSGAVLFAHHKLPLGHVLQTAHDLLDAVAKTACGRDALAVQVSSRGGELVRWAQPWTVGLGDGPELVLERLAAEMAGGDAPFSHRFFHRIEALLRLVNPDPERGSDPLDDDVAVDLFTAELLDSSRYRDRPAAGGGEGGAGDETSDEEKAGERLAGARARVTALLDQCRPRRSEGEAADAEALPQPRLESGGAFLVRFLERHHPGSAQS